jgi:undecaprenyl-diphosphatase
MRLLVQQVGSWDRACLAGIAARRAPPWLDRAFCALTHAGGARVTMAFSTLLLLDPATRRVGLATALANLVSHLAVQALKRTVVRPRPHLSLDTLDALAHIPDAFSFPSGHTAASFAIALTVLFIGPPALGIPMLALAILVGASRVYLRVHYVTDVVAGQLLGAGGALLAVMVLA